MKIDKTYKVKIIRKDDKDMVQTKMLQYFYNVGRDRVKQVIRMILIAVHEVSLFNQSSPTVALIS